MACEMSRGIFKRAICIGQLLGIEHDLPGMVAFLWEIHMEDGLYVEGEGFV